MLATQTPFGCDVAYRLPDYNNIRFDGKHRVKEGFKGHELNLLEGAGTKTEKKLKEKISGVFLR